MKRFANPGLFLFGEPQRDEETGTPDPVPPAQTGETGTSDAGKNKEETRKRFRDLMEGEFKEEFTAYFNETFNRRFKEQKGIMEELALARAVVEAAKARYGTDSVEQLPGAIRADIAVTAPTEAKAVSREADTAERETLDVRIREEVAKAVASARAETERAVMETIRARGLRPTENALSALPSGRGSERSHLTRAERAEVALRAAKGEHITF